jgi:hypothetical protein
MKSFLTLVAVLVFGASSVQANTFMYNNSTNDLVVRFNPGLLEVGDEIDFEPGTPRILDSFSFEYYSVANNDSGVAGTLAGSPEAQVRFYANNGAPVSSYASPGTLLYDSGRFSVPTTETERSTFVFTSGADFPAAGLDLTGYNTITWSVQIHGLEKFDEIGLDLYDPPVVGSSPADFWQFDGIEWKLKQLEEGPNVNFASVFVGKCVPDGGATVALLGAGLTALAFVSRRRQR